MYTLVINIHMHAHTHICTPHTTHQTFVIVVTMMRELYDDIKRYIRDKEVNVQQYYKLTKKG